MPNTVIIEVYDSRIMAWNAPGGMINRYIRSITRQVEIRAMIYAPARTHRLQDSIKGTVGFNAIGVFAKVRASAPYARYVHEGTYGPITPRTAPYMVWSGWGPWAGGDRRSPDGKWRRKWVRGQKAQPFLRRALRDVLRQHRLL